MTRRFVVLLCVMFFAAPSVGAQWAKNQSLPTNITILSVAEHPSNFRILAVGTLGGIYLSLDEGLTWTHIGLVGKQVRSIVFNPHDDGGIFAGTNKGLYVTRDHGQFWKQILIGLSTNNPTLVYGHPINQTSFALYTAPDGDGAYRAVVTKAVPQPTTFRKWSISKRIDVRTMVSSGSVVYATTQHGLARSEDYGLNWEFFHHGIMSGIAVDPKNTDHVFIGVHPRDIVESIDGGRAFKPVKAKLPEGDVISLAYLPRDMVVAVINGGGVFTLESFEGKWELATEGLVSWNAERNTLLVRRNGQTQLGMHDGLYVLQQKHREIREGDYGLLPGFQDLNIWRIGGGRPDVPFEIILPQAHYVLVSIIDETGKSVRVFEKHFQAGSHHIGWDGRDDNGAFVKDGTYVCRAIVNQKLLFQSVTVYRRLLSN